MREKFEQYMSKGFHDHALKFPECENTQFESGFDVAQDIAEKFYSQSLAEARREERERIKYDEKLWEYLRNPAFVSASDRLKELLRGRK